MPEQTFLSGNYAPVDDERDGVACEVTGTLPEGLRGTLYRNGSNPRFRPVEPYHWFTGDGMVHAIRLEGGRAHYSNRWVRTPRFEAEAKAGRPLFAGFGQPLTEAAAALDTGVANTHVITHAGRLLALEEAHLPVRLDASDLATIGYDDFGGALSGRFTAHPKRDPATGQLVFFSYSATGPFSPDMAWGTIEADGRVSRHEVFTAPYCSMVHDFAVTGTHIVFPVLPLTGDMDRAMAGLPPFAWDPSAGAFLGVMRRDRGMASLSWQQIPTAFVFHVMNAFDEGGGIVMDVVEYDSPPLFPNPDGSPRDSDGPGSRPGSQPASRLARWRLNGGAMVREVLSDLPGEFPRLDERYAGSRYRYGLRICTMPDGAEAIVVHDLDQGLTRQLVMPAGEIPSEAVFVPRHPGSGEADGWLLSVVWQPERGQSALWVVDAQQPEAGPAAVVRLPRRVPFGFHGSWAAA